MLEQILCPLTSGIILAPNYSLCVSHFMWVLIFICLCALHMRDLRRFFLVRYIFYLIYCFRQLFGWIYCCVFILLHLLRNLWDFLKALTLLIGIPLYFLTLFRTLKILPIRLKLSVTSNVNDASLKQSIPSTWSSSTVSSTSFISPISHNYSMVPSGLSIAILKFLFCCIFNPLRDSLL